MDKRERYCIGLDIGTSSVKGVLIDDGETVLRTARVPFTYSRDEAGGITVGAQAYFDGCMSALQQLAKGLPAGCECLVSVASASGNLLVLDKDMLPATPIFNWQDTRVREEVGQVFPDFDYDSYYRSTGWAFDGKTFPLALLCWLRVRHPELLDSCGKVCMSTEYMLWRLTGEWGIAPSAGTPFYLIDQTTGHYRTDILARLGIGEEKLPPVGKTGSLLGCVSPEGAALSGLPVGTRVLLGTFDHPSAARGTGVHEEGQLLLSCGSSWVGFYPMKERETALKARMLVDPFLSEAGGCWAGMVSLASVSGRIEAYTRRYVSDGPACYKQLVEFAAQSEPGAGGLRLDILSDEIPAGIEGCERRHIARAIMENVVDMLACRIEELRDKGLACREATMVGGPSESPLWMELIAARLGIPVHAGHGAYAGAVGAARLAAENAEG